jgi:flavin reductase
MNSFTQAMRRAVNGVSIVTTDGDYGRFGLTVSSMTSVSADPPMLLVCINRDSVTHDAIAAHRRFAVNVLAAHQQHVAAGFAGSPALGSAYDFGSDDWSATASGLPQLADPAALFECELESSIEAGTHSIFLGRVLSASGRDNAPLAYSNREYGVPVPLAATNVTHISTDNVLAANRV